jgi:hypothetical protein
MCAALHAATETDPVVKEVAWRTFALIRAHREQSDEVCRLNNAVKTLGAALQLDSMAVVDELKRHAGDACLPIQDVERFLKRERDEYVKGTLVWNALDGVLDCFRLHMVTGTPLTEPRPEEGATDPSVGRPPLTEAEELRIEVDRITSERDKAVETVKHTAAAMVAVGTVLENAVRTAAELGAGAGMDTIIGYLSDAGMLPDPAVQPVPDGG